MSAPRRVLIVGYGFMGRIHADNVRRHPELELAGVVDPALPALVDVPVFADLDAALAALKPQIAVVAVHTMLHCRVAGRCLEAGCDVLLEKPISLDLVEARALKELAERQKRLLMIGHCLRFFPAYCRLRQFLKSGELGRLKLLKLYRHNAEPHWGQWQDETVKRNWGGAFFDLAIHDIDFVLSIFGEPERIEQPGGVAGCFGTLYLNAVWYYRSGEVVTIESGSIFPPGFTLRAGGWAAFEKGSITFAGDGSLFELCTDGRKQQLAVEPGCGYFEMLDYFNNAVAGREPLRCCTAGQAIRTIEVCRRHLPAGS